MIKTVMAKIDNSEEFDRKVNEAISDGWRLVTRNVWADVLSRTLLLYAELEKREPEENDPGALLEAARRIKLECERSEDCKDCHLCGICDHQTPDEWTHTGHHEDGGAG